MSGMPGNGTCELRHLRRVDAEPASFCSPRPSPPDSPRTHPPVASLDGIGSVTGGAMSLSGFSAPWWLLLFVFVAGLVAGYVLVMAERKRRLLRFANLPLLERVAPKGPGGIRHLAPALLLVSLIFFVIGVAGPTAEQRLPRNRATVMLVVDVSLSMKATDVRPNRLAAAQAAATSFVENMTPGINLGLISFGGTATVLVSPTTDRDGVVRAIKRLELTESTAT